ncbi:cysteine desulfurase NifS [Candidatus Entotheonella serta]|nr:cysteine desulfurase NifS [Candidatus Entotheonella serta]
MRQLYLDHNATTPVHPEVRDVLMACYKNDFGNPSSVHRYGRRTRVQVDEARDTVATLIGSPAASIFFCSGGTEANNTIIKGVAEMRQDRGRHIITAPTEHPAVLDPCAYLAQHGFDVTYLPVDEAGVVDLQALEDALTDATALVSIMHANNETGVIQPIADIARLAHQRGALVHTDAVQSFGKIPINVDTLDIDFLSFSGHKLYAPKGIGGWYARTPTALQPLLHGGHQERGLRSGTESVPSIMALSKACEIAARDMAAEWERLQQLQQRLEHGILESIPNARIQSANASRLPNTSNIAFAEIEGETLLMSLDLQGVAISTGSACSSGSLEPSHVLKAMAVPETHLYGALRLSMGRSTTPDDIDYVLECLPDMVQHANLA